MNDSAPSLNKLQHEKSLRKPYAGNLQVRFDEEEGAARPPLLTLLYSVVSKAKCVNIRPRNTRKEYGVKSHAHKTNKTKKKQKRTGTAIDGHGDFGTLFRLFRFFVLGFLL